MLLDTSAVAFKLDGTDTPSLLSWVDDVEAESPSGFWTLGHDADRPYDHFELTNHTGSEDTTPFRVRTSDEVEVTDLAVTGRVTSPLELATDSTRITGFDANNEHWVYADSGETDQSLAIERVAADDYQLHVSEGDTVETALTTGDEGTLDAGTLGGNAPSEFLYRDGRNALTGNLVVDGAYSIFGGGNSVAFATSGEDAHLSTDGNGGGWHVWDDANDRQLVEFVEGGDIRVPHGDIFIDGTAVVTEATDETIDAENTDGTPLVEDIDAINAGTELSFSDDQDGSVTLSYTGPTDFPGGWAGDTTTTSGDGSTTTFTLTHSLDAVPDSVSVDPITQAASTDFWITDATTDDITIEYASAPPSGTDNLEWYVTAATGNLNAVTVSDTGSKVLAAPDDLNFGAGLTVGDDGDNTVTITPTDAIPRGDTGETIDGAWHFNGGVSVHKDVDVGYTNGSHTTQFAHSYDSDADVFELADRANTTTIYSVNRSGTLDFASTPQINGTDVATVADTRDGGSATTATTASAEGDGSTTTFALAHGAGSTPTAAFVQPTSKAAMSDFRVSNKTSSDVVITYQSPPPSGDGSDNLEYDLIVHE